MKKITVKEKLLRFVEKKGSARFTEMQRFLVDNNYGKGTYDKGKQYKMVWVGKELRKRLVNIWRGYYCCAFSGTCSSRPYFMVGSNRLEKQKDGSYKVIRENKKKQYENSKKRR